VTPRSAMRGQQTCSYDPNGNGGNPGAMMSPSPPFCGLFSLRSTHPPAHGKQGTLPLTSRVICMYE
jgi:hypothetical protein